MSYRSHVLRLAVSSGANADSVAAVLLTAGAALDTRDDDADTPSDMVTRCERQSVIEESLAAGEMDLRFG